MLSSMLIPTRLSGSHIGHLCSCFVQTFGNGCRYCLRKWQASHIPSISSSLKVGGPMMTPFYCIPLSFWRLIWSIPLCHSFILVATLWSFANMANFTLFDLRINILPSLRPRAMLLPSFSMKQPPWLNQTCMPCSTIWPIETKFFVIVETCNMSLM